MEKISRPAAARFLGRKIQCEKILPTVLILLVMLLFLIPIFIAVLTAFKTKLEIAESVLAFPKALRFDNFVEGLKKSNMFVSLKNSCIITFPSVALIVICSSMSGYSIARFGPKHKPIKMMDTVYLASMMIPFQILMIPIYKMCKNLHLLNNQLSVILILTGISIAYASFLYVGFVKSIPQEIEEAALIDGCGPFRAFWSIVFPLLKPITATVASLHVMWLWNDFNVSLVLLSKEAVRPFTVKQYYFFAEHASDYGPAIAASIVGMIPVIIVFLLLQKYIVRGISAGAVKS